MNALVEPTIFLINLNAMLHVKRSHSILSPAVKNCDSRALSFPASRPTSIVSDVTACFRFHVVDSGSWPANSGFGCSTNIHHLRRTRVLLASLDLVTLANSVSSKNHVLRQMRVLLVSFGFVVMPADSGTARRSNLLCQMRVLLVSLGLVTPANCVRCAFFWFRVVLL